MCRKCISRHDIFQSFTRSKLILILALTLVLEQWEPHSNVKARKSDILLARNFHSS